MSEQPTYTIAEIPVLEPNIFLLNRANRWFIEGQAPTPIVEEGMSNQMLALFFYFALLGLVLVGIVMSNPLWGTQFHGAILLGVLIVGVIGGMAFLRYQMGDDKALSIKGTLVRGEVTHAEKIRVVQGTTSRELLAVHYRCTAPGGVVIYERAEGESDLASMQVAPLVGTSVFVWYTDDGKPYLL